MYVGLFFVVYGLVFWKSEKNSTSKRSALQ